jgi:hypothetical protein
MNISSTPLNILFACYSKLLDETPCYLNISNSLLSILLACYSKFLNVTPCYLNISNSFEYPICLLFKTPWRISLLTEHQQHFLKYPIYRLFKTPWLISSILVIKTPEKRSCGSPTCHFLLYLLSAYSTTCNSHWRFLFVISKPAVQHNVLDRPLFGKRYRPKYHLFIVWCSSVCSLVTEQIFFRFIRAILCLNVTNFWDVEPYSLADGPVPMVACSEVNAEIVGSNLA